MGIPRSVRAALLAAIVSSALSASAMAQDGRITVTLQELQGVNAQPAAEQLLVQVDALVRLANAGEAQWRALLSRGEVETLTQIQRSLAADPFSPDLLRVWQGFLDGANLANVDVNALVAWVLRESYLQTTEDLRFYAEKVKAYNEMKQAIRDELERIRAHACRGENCPPFQTNARALQTSFGSAFLTRQSQIATYQAELEAQLEAIGDDAQLANVDLQSILQRQQQTLQMISNISKQLYDTAMAAIRNIGG
ncbi:MAG: hypothetical protein WEB63_01650 [Cucumibacter sp.]